MSSLSVQKQSGSSEGRDQLSEGREDDLLIGEEISKTASNEGDLVTLFDTKLYILLFTCLQPDPFLLREREIKPNCLENRKLSWKKSDSRHVTACCFTFC